MPMPLIPVCTYYVFQFMVSGTSAQTLLVQTHWHL